MTPFEVARLVRDAVRRRLPSLRLDERVGAWLGFDPAAIEPDVIA